MPPKAAPKAAAKPAAKKTAAAKKKKGDDDEMAFLIEQQKAAAALEAKAKAKAKADKAKADEKAREAAVKQKAADAERKQALSLLPPLYVDDVTKALFEKHGGESYHFRDFQYLAYVLYNFFALTAEMKRPMYIRSAPGDAVKSIGCMDIDDKDGSVHSWNTFTTASGKTFAVDVTLKQFEPSGRYGQKRDANAEALGWVPVEGPSRLVTSNGEPHVGSPAKDGGILPPEGVMAVKDIKPGHAAEYMKFLTNARCGRFNNMSASEAATARVLYKQKAVARLVEGHEFLTAKIIDEPLGEIEAKRAAKHADPAAAATEKK